MPTAVQITQIIDIEAVKGGGYHVVVMSGAVELEWYFSEEICRMGMAKMAAVVAQRDKCRRANVVLPFERGGDQHSH